MTTLKNRLYSLLRRAERYTRTDMVYLARGGFWSLTGQLAASLLSFLLAIGVAHLLSKESYGEYKYILAVVSILGMFSLTGLGSAVFQSVARGFDGAMQEGFWSNLRWSVLMFLGAFALSAYYFFLHNDVLAFGILVGGCFSPLLASANLSNSFLAAKKDFRRQSIYFDIVENLIPVAALLTTILLTQNPAIIAAVYFLSNTLVTLYLYRRVVRIYRPDARKRDRGMFSYGGHLSIMGILSGIASNIDQILLFHFAGAADLAIYNFAIAIPSQTKGPLKSLDSMIQARLVNRSEQDIRRGMRNKIILLLVSSVALVGLYIVLAPVIYEIFFPKYIDAVFYSQIYALAYLGTTLTPVSSYLSAKKKVRQMYLSNTAASIIRITALFIGVYYWGLLGLVIARTAAHLSGLALNYLLYSFSSGNPEAA